MLVRIKVSALWDTHWHEYALRFGLGGLATVRTGLIAEVFGPATRLPYRGLATNTSMSGLSICQAENRSFA